MTPAPHQSSGLELLPCPFCGGKDGFVERADFSDCYVICNDCSARGPEMCDMNDADAVASESGKCEPGEMPARRLWNTRAPIDPTTAAGTLRDANLITPEQYNRICERVGARDVFRGDS